MPTEDRWAVKTDKLTKTYGGDVRAVVDLDLRLREQTVYALLGPNGAGKTTTLSMLNTLVRPTSGTAVVAGFDIHEDPNAVRRSIGVTFQEMVLDRDLTGRQVLDLHARLYRMDPTEREARIESLVTLIELEESIDRLVKTYSGGMKRRLELARGLMTQPEILFLDEPTLGLDPQNRTKLWEYIQDLKAEARLTLLLTTHYMVEAAELADQVGIIDRGRLVVEGSPAQLVAEMGAHVIRVSGHGQGKQFMDRIRGLEYVDGVHESGEVLQVGVDNGDRRLPEIVSMAAASGYAIEDVSVAKPSLGDVFLKYTGRELRDT